LGLPQVRNFQLGNTGSDFVSLHFTVLFSYVRMNKDNCDDDDDDDDERLRNVYSLVHRI